MVDPKPAARIRNASVRPLDETPLRHGICPLCGYKAFHLTRHHVVPRSLRGDDVPENLIWTCGDGTQGCHGCLETGHRGGHALEPAEVRARLVVYCRETQPLLGVYADAKRWPGWLEGYYGVSLEAEEAA